MRAAWLTHAGVLCLISCATVIAGELEAPDSDSNFLLNAHKRIEAARKQACKTEACAPSEVLSQDDEDLRFGTLISWAKSPDDARQQAEKRSKLAYILHLSGNFEKPQFT